LLIEIHTDIKQTFISNNDFTMTSAILLQSQKESHRNLQPFTGDLSQDVDEYIGKIEHIGSLTKEPDEILHVLLTEKLSGEAEKWYKDSHESLTTWSKLRSGFRNRFQQPWLNRTLFSTLDNKKQEAHRVGRVKPFFESSQVESSYFCHFSVFCFFIKSVSNKFFMTRYLVCVNYHSRPYEYIGREKLLKKIVLMQYIQPGRQWQLWDLFFGTFL